MRMVDVFPQPEGPTRTMNSPSEVSSEKSSTAETSAKRFETCLSSTLAIVRRVPFFSTARDRGAHQNRLSHELIHIAGAAVHVVAGARCSATFPC